MPDYLEKYAKTVIDREMLMRLKNCAACGRKFNLGEPVVLACGAWDGPPEWIHEEETVFDPQTATYVVQGRDETPA